MKKILLVCTENTGKDGKGEASPNHWESEKVLVNE
jgi:hypothetical protein